MRETPANNLTPIEDIMSTSETSGSTSTLTIPSPASEDTESEVFESRPQIIDPLRFPIQDDQIIHSKKDYARGKTSTTRLNCSKSPRITSDTEASKSCLERTSQKRKNFNLSELERSLPSCENYVPETVDFPSSPPNSRAPNVNLSGVVRLEEDDSHVINSCRDISKASVTSKDTPLKARPKDLDVIPKKKISVSDDTLTGTGGEYDQQSLTSLSCHNTDDDDDDAQMLSHDEFTDMLTPDDIDTPDALEESIMERLGPEPQLAGGSCPAGDTSDPENSWRSVVISGIQRRIDMTVIEPYKKVLSHGGYMPREGSEAIIVFSACFLPDRSRIDYDYVMDHLFMYVLTTLDLLVSEDYVLVYLHGATSRGNMPSFAWLKRCYQMIDRRLRKNLQGLYLVHPSFWVKTVVIMARPFVSSKFSRKLRFIGSLKELKTTIPLDQASIPARVKQYDDIRETLLSGKR